MRQTGARWRFGPAASRRRPSRTLTTSKSMWPHHIIFLGCVFAMLARQEAAAQKAQPGRIVGHIDGISQDGDHYFLLGWACQQGQSKSITVQLFADKVDSPVARR